MNGCMSMDGAVCSVNLAMQKLGFNSDWVSFAALGQLSYVLVRPGFNYRD